MASSIIRILLVITLFSAGYGLRNSASNYLRPWWQSRAFSASRIVGGYEIDISDAPYQVSLIESYGQFCGGTLISNRWVLTAAHCASSYNYPTLQVRVGSIHHNKGGQLIDVQRIIQHPKYNYATIDYDFCLLELAEDVEFTAELYPADLPVRNEPVEDGTCLQVSGWGNTQNALENRNVLRATTVPSVNQNKCAEAYASVGPITDQMLCAGYDKGGKDACQGDSGGPLVEGNKLVGVVSWGRGCAEEGFPGVYSRVAVVRDWISEVSGI